MLLRAARRALGVLSTVAGISIVSYLALYSRPEDVLAHQAGLYERTGAADVGALRHELGLDRPILTRLVNWLGGLARGDMGLSWSQHRPVREILLHGLPLTLALTGTGLFLQVLLGVGVAGASLRRPDSWQETLLNAGAMAAYAIPPFCLGLLLLWPLSTRLGWFPASGVYREPERVWATGSIPVLDLVHHLILPALCLGLGGAAVVARLLRVRWREEMGTLYIAAARARGLKERRILWRHGFRTAAGPLCTAVGLSLPGLIGGAVLVEQVFSWPGLGSVLVSAVSDRDLPLLAGVNVVLAFLVTLGGLFSDLVFMALDPRIRLR